MRACFQLRHRPCLRPPAHAQRLGQSAGARTGLDRPVAKTDTIALWPLACSWMIPRRGGFMQDRGSYSTTQSKTCRRPQRHEARDTQKVSARFAFQRKASGIPSVVRVRQRQHSRHPPQAPLLGSALCRDPMFSHQGYIFQICRATGTGIGCRRGCRDNCAWHNDHHRGPDPSLRSRHL